MEGGGPFAVGDPKRLTLRRWYAMTGGWALLLAPHVWLAGTTDRPVAVRVLLVLVALGYVACFVHGLYVAVTRRRPAVSAALIAVMAALWVVGVVGADRNDGSGLYAVSFLVVVVAVLVPLPHGLPVTVATALSAVGVAWLAGERVDWGSAVAMAGLGLAMIAMLWLIRANSELREAREELARMAVTTERERMARDLHDVLGHSLTTITVKAGLARRLLERGDSGPAADEVADVERLGRQALAEVRSTVSANRVASLPRELAGAREALRAAGIDADLPQAVDDVPPERQQVFAHVVREGVTNVIRHSGAGTCTVRLAPDSVEVVDDGVGSPASTQAGNGLGGLTERVAAIGGWVDAGPAPAGGYRLRAACAPAHRSSRRTGPA